MSAIAGERPGTWRRFRAGGTPVDPRPSSCTAPTARSPASATVPAGPSRTARVAGSAVTPAGAPRPGRSASGFRNAAACPALSAPDPPMIRTDRELLADLARLNSDVVPLAMQIIDDIATREEQQIFAERLIELGTRLSHRARHTAIVIDSDNATDGAEYARREP